MAWLLPLILAGFPVLEIATFVVAVNALGFLATVALALAGAMVGLMVLRHQEVLTSLSVRQQIRQGRLPSEAMFDQLCLVIAGILLIFPGFISDFLAIVLLIPPVRRLGHHLLNRWLTQSAPKRPPDIPPIIEGDYRVLDREDER